MRSWDSISNSTLDFGISMWYKVAVTTLATLVVLAAAAMGWALAATVDNVGVVVAGVLLVLGLGALIINSGLNGE